ncbi:MAG: hypothetical protein AAGI70_12780 [Pseudomonadota bacterium]
MVDRPGPRKLQAPPDPWLVQRDTIRGMWRVAIWVLLALVLFEFALHERHPYFEQQLWPGFAAWYGFGVCAALVFVSKVLGYVLKRRDDYYE